MPVFAKWKNWVITPIRGKYRIGYSNWLSTPISRGERAFAPFKLRAYVKCRIQKSIPFFDMRKLGNGKRSNYRHLYFYMRFCTSCLEALSKPFCQNNYLIYYNSTNKWYCEESDQHFNILITVWSDSCCCCVGVVWKIIFTISDKNIILFWSHLIVHKTPCIVQVHERGIPSVKFIDPNYLVKPNKWTGRVNDAPSRG